MPHLFENMPIDTLLKIRGFGTDCLIDLLDSVFSSSTGQTVLRTHEQPQVVGRDVGEVIRQSTLIPGHVMRRQLPVPVGVKSLNELNLENRTFNALRKAGFLRHPARIGDLTVAAALNLRGFGTQCLVDLVEKIYRSNDGTLPFDASEVNETVPRNLREMTTADRSFPAEVLDKRLPSLPTGTSLESLDLELRSFNALEKAGYGRTPDRLSRLPLRSLLRVRGIGAHGVCDVVEAAYAAAGREGKPVANTFDRQVLNCLIPNRNRRDRDIVSFYFGLSGEAPHTLEETGQRAGITRERVRQIISRRKSHLRTLFKENQRIGLMGRLVRLAPCTAASVETCLRSEEVLEPTTTLESVLQVLDLGGMQHQLKVTGTGSGRLLVKEDHANLADRIRSEALKRLWRIGAYRMDSLIEDLPSSVTQHANSLMVTAVITSIPGFQWLDDSQSWFWIRREKPIRLQRKIRRVLSVAPVIAIGELRAALRRDIRQYAVPPSRILTELCCQLENCVVEAGVVSSLCPEPAHAVLKGKELEIVQLLMQHGPVCSRKSLQELATASGIGLPSFWRCLNFCQTITRIAPGVYGLTGADVSPEVVAALQADSDEPTSVLQDHGWTANGEIWIGYRLSKPSLKSGVLGVPGARKELLIGEYHMVDAKSKTVGKLVVRDHSLWGLGPFFRRAGAEVGDTLVLVVSRSTNSAVARLGDDGLIQEVCGD